MTIVVDETQLGRRASGIERVTAALFSKSALSPLPVEAERGSPGRLAILLKQSLAMPAKAAARRRSVWVFPGFPPSPAFAFLRDRSVLYVHDVFLITRRADLNRAGRYWLAPNFRLALRNLKYFMVNSLTTAETLRPFVRDTAQIVVYRPGADNVFGLAPDRPEPRSNVAPLIVGAIGTIEPRKNLPAAARICERLAHELGRPVELHVIGRKGWGSDYDLLAAMPHVKLHGFLPDDAARAAIAGFDFYLCTSHDEGLGLPLLEAQFGGLQIVAPDQPVFREVLGGSGLFITPGDAEGSASIIAAHLAQPDWRQRAAKNAAANITRWNAAAASDRQGAIAFLGGLLREVH